ncbi:glycosyltransferase family A protein [Pedobacter sp. L105]|uniref:glycosyltransferase family A protein n=1 Tax=Pedobacter sp. L105 TaxID=1641871 RepID=UPI00131AFE43|nr:glycosyltransferase family 2 protein [Pedobacter sp. L105]
MNKGISIIVCTYNGALRLPETIKHLAMQSAIQQQMMEIIIVDNASTDNSAAVAIKEWKKYDLNKARFVIATEARPGKINALELGVSIASYEYFIICDDDNWLSPQYAEKMQAILENNPNIGAAGGTGIAVAESGKLPHWFKDFEEGYATGKQGPTTGDVTARGHLWGAGLGSRTALYKDTYKNFPSFLTGRFEKSLTAGEDAEYCQRLILQGYSLYYSEDLIFQHFMPSARLTKEYTRALFKGFADSNQVLDKYYLANKLIAKCKKNKFASIWMRFTAYLNATVLNPFQYKEKQKDILIFLSGVQPKTDSIMGKIRKLYEDKSRTSLRL